MATSGNAGSEVSSEAGDKTGTKADVVEKKQRYKHVVFVAQLNHECCKYNQLGHTDEEDHGVLLNDVKQKWEEEIDISHLSLTIGGDSSLRVTTTIPYRTVEVLENIPGINAREWIEQKKIKMIMLPFNFDISLDHLNKLSELKEQMTIYSEDYHCQGHSSVDPSIEFAYRVDATIWGAGEENDTFYIAFNGRWR